MHHPHHFHHHSMSGDIAQGGNCLSGFSPVWTTLCSLKWPVPDFYTWDWRQHARMRKVRVGHQRSRKYFHKLSFVCCRMRIYVIYYPSSMWTQLPRESKVFKNFYWCMFENTSQYQSALSSEQSSVSYSSLLFFTSKGIGTIIAVFHSEIEEIGKIEKTGSNAWFIETTIYEYSDNIDPDDNDNDEKCVRIEKWKVVRFENVWTLVSMLQFMLITLRDVSQQKKRENVGILKKTNPTSFVIWPSCFRHAKFILRC